MGGRWIREGDVGDVGRGGLKGGFLESEDLSGKVCSFGLFWVSVSLDVVEAGGGME